VTIQATQRPHQLVSRHAWSRATGLRSHWHYTAPGTAALALWRSCPMHRPTGRLDSPVAIPHTLGNWRCCRTPPLRRPRSTTRQPLHMTNVAAQLQPTAISTSARITTSFYRRIRRHITSKTDQPNGHKSHGCVTSTNSHFYHRTHHYISLPAYTAPPHWLEETALFRAPQTLRSGLPNRRTSHIHSFM
jgi:hypothetical protein